MLTRTATRPAHRARLGAVGLVLGGALSVQFGAGVAALLFPRAGVAGVVTLRLVLAAVALLVVCRPRVRGHSAGDWLVIVGFGVALVGMNGLIYAAIMRIPLGVAVTVEVLGPLVLSVIAGRGGLRWLWAALALVGVVLLGRGSLDGLDPVGVLFAMGAAVMWAAYILLSARAGSRFPKADGLALAVAVAAVLTLPWGLVAAGSALLDPVTVGLGAAVAVLSTVLPYTMELSALRRLPTSTFAVLSSLSPVCATLAGFLVLGQTLTGTQLLAIVLVVAASAGAVRATRDGDRRHRVQTLQRVSGTATATAPAPTTPAEPAVTLQVGPAGNDTNDGSPNAPLRTIQAGLERATPGSVINLAST